MKKIEPFSISDDDEYTFVRFLPGEDGIEIGVRKGNTNKFIQYDYSATTIKSLANKLLKCVEYIEYKKTKGGKK